MHKWGPRRRKTKRGKGPILKYVIKKKTALKQKITFTLYAGKKTDLEWSTLKCVLVSYWTLKNPNLNTFINIHIHAQIFFQMNIHKYVIKILFQYYF